MTTNATTTRPVHYTRHTEHEPIDVIEEWGLGFHLGNAVKYIARADCKGDYMADLQKARWYIDRELALEVRRRDEEPVR